MARIDNADGKTALVGTKDADVLNATLSLQTGQAYLIGGLGDDLYIIDDPEAFSLTGDLVVEDPGGGIDTVRSLAFSTFLMANVENLILAEDTLAPAVDAYGNELDNQITGNFRDNWIDGWAGADVMAGGDGDDTYIVDNAGDKVVEAAGLGQDTVRASVTYTLALNVERLILEDGFGSLNGTGNALDNEIDGNDANNVLAGLAGQDDLNGEAGNDTLDGGEGDDRLDGGDGNDTLSGGAGDDQLDGGDGADKMTGGAGNDDFIVDDAGDVVVEAAAGGSDRVVSEVSRTLEANVEDLVLAAAAAEALTGTGNAVANHIEGNEFDNALSGLDGDDTLDGGAGNDTLMGGKGNDILVVDSFADWVVELPGEGTDTVVSSIDYSLGPNLENLTLVGDAYWGGGNDAPNVIRAISGNHDLHGYGGNDTLIGGTGFEFLQGGPGDDSYYLDGIDFVVELANEGTDTVFSWVELGLRLFVNVENHTLLGSANAALRGNELNNILTGNAGDNFMEGVSGIDTFVGGAGNDSYIVNSFNPTSAATSDKVVENPSAGIDTVYAYVGSYILPLNVERLFMGNTFGGDGTGNALDNYIEGNFATNVLKGLNGNDTILGRSGDDTLEGGAGNDVLDGGVGQDSMLGGPGNDSYWVDRSTDVVDERGGSGLDTVFSTAATFNLDSAAAAGVENLTLVAGSAAVTGNGNGGANVITGNALANNLFGQGGNDTLDGGAGIDVMDGGAGNDTFLVDHGNDVVVEGLGGGTDLVRSTASFDLSTTVGRQNVENLTLLGSADIDGTGNDLVNVLIGNDGSNELDGRAGADDMRGGKGNDLYYASVATDKVTELANEGIDAVVLQFATAGATFALGANVEMAGFDEDVPAIQSVNMNLTGNALPNALFGNDGNNTLTGADGNDWLIGEAGNDKLVGGNGNDFLDGDNGGDGLYTGGATLDGGAGDDTYVADANDTIIDSAGTDWVLTPAANFVMGAGIENLYLFGDGPQTITGNGLGNIIFGFANAGPADADNLSGGGGDDTFVLTDYIKDAANWAGLLEALGEPVLYPEIGVALGANDVVNGGDGSDLLEAAVFDLNLAAAGPANITGAERVNFYSGGTTGSAIDLDELPDTATVFVYAPHDPTGEGYTSADIAFTNVPGAAVGGADFMLGIEGFDAGVSATVDGDEASGTTTLELQVREFYGDLSATGFEILDFTVWGGNNFDLAGATASTGTYRFHGETGTTVRNLENGASVEFDNFNALFAIDSGASFDSLNLETSNSSVEVQALGTTLASFQIEAVGEATTMGVGQVVMDPGAAITISGDARFSLYTYFANIDGSEATGNLRLYTDGGNTNDLELRGGLGEDYIFGGAGNDRLAGGGGPADLLGGGGGEDTFVFDINPADNPATAAVGDASVAYLFGFVSGEDTLELDSTVFAGLAPGDLDLDDFEKVEEIDPTTSKLIVFEQSSGNLYYNAGGAGGADPVVFANVWYDQDVNASDFVIV